MNTMASLSLELNLYSVSMIGSNLAAVSFSTSCKCSALASYVSNLLYSRRWSCRRTFSFCNSCLSIRSCLMYSSGKRCWNTSSHHATPSEYRFLNVLSFVPTQSKAEPRVGASCSHVKSHSPLSLACPTRHIYCRGLSSTFLVKSIRFITACLTYLYFLLLRVLPHYRVVPAGNAILRIRSACVLFLQCVYHGIVRASVAPRIL